MDLSKALQFSNGDLQSFRKGSLSAASCQVLLAKVIAPAAKAAAVTVVPLIALAFYVTNSNHASISDGLSILVSRVGNIKEFAENEGWFRTVLYGVGALALLGLGVYYTLKIPLGLLADIIAKQVLTLDGRVTGREEEKGGKGKADEVVDYFFEMRQGKFPVNRRAFQTLDSGGSYRVYYLPRSKTLVAIEPSALAKEAEEKEARLKDRPPIPEGAI